jgi:hypothetical protein
MAKKVNKDTHFATPLSRGSHTEQASSRWKGKHLKDHGDPDDIAINVGQIRYGNGRENKITDVAKEKAVYENVAQHAGNETGICQIRPKALAVEFLIEKQIAGCDDQEQGRKQLKERNIRWR